LLSEYACRCSWTGVRDHVESQLLKGVLDVAVLAVLERADSYGYHVV